MTKEIELTEELELNEDGLVVTKGDWTSGVTLKARISSLFFGTKHEMDKERHSKEDAIIAYGNVHYAIGEMNELVLALIQKGITLEELDDYRKKRNELTILADKLKKEILTK